LLDGFFRPQSTASCNFLHTFFPQQGFPQPGTIPATA
jgi:hypothetical protein